MFKDILTALFFVKDIRASKEWYQRFLSMDPIEDLPDFSSFKIGSSFLNLHLADEKSPVSTGGTVVYWTVEDLQKAIEKAVLMGALFIEVLALSKKLIELLYRYEIRMEMYSVWKNNKNYWLSFYIR